MTDAILEPEPKPELRTAWEGFLEGTAGLRPTLFRFARGLTGNAFDAEDLVHEALLRAFASTAMHHGNIRSPRSYLFRTLTNLWIDECRRARPDPLGGAEEERVDETAKSPEREAQMRDAAEEVLALSPRERAAVVLKDAFDLPHAEVAEILSTTEGAVKVALHRGRKRIENARDQAPRPSRVSRELVDRFVDAFRARDMEGLKALLVEDAEATVFGGGMGVGREHHAKEGWLNGCFYHHIEENERSGVPYPMRLDVLEWEGEPVVLAFRDHGHGEALEEVWRFEEEDGRIGRVRDYCFSPDLVEHVAKELGVPWRMIAYRFDSEVYARLAAGEVPTRG